ncbi:MAG: hypothetical protein Terrestrivirus5_185 [Terrestrivirus sp.]|uniref:Uncharacterized protein n=1 Tax=Terrestrivirus sp. TaxID=2487775 RepID=A0A3G4ZRY7_9VIRU|nr:MAG: hypothetical protein Terrestrivirus5_185 [Terrestrivirus sp.]
MGDKILNQMDLYREEQRKKYERNTRKQYLIDKYSNLLILDSFNRSLHRIKYFTKKYVLRDVANKNSYKENKIPGLFTLRLQMTEFNLYTTDLQKSILDDINKGNETNRKQLIDEVTAGITEDVLKQAIIESLGLNNINNDITEKCPLIESKLFTVMIDLRIYGKIPDMPIFVLETDQTLYLTEEQKKYIAKIWNKIDPETTNGMRYQQMIDCSKSLVELYTKKYSQIDPSDLVKPAEPIESVNPPKKPLPGKFTINIPNPDKNKNPKIMSFRDLKK